MCRPRVAQVLSRYYQTDLPRRLHPEKQTLARLTGWRMNEIDALPGVLRFLGAASPGDASPGSPESTGNTGKPWWEQLFNTGSAVPNAAINLAANLNAVAGTNLTRTGTASESAPQAVAKVAR